MSAMIRANVSIIGEVQGVFFRANACEKADKLGIKGWVANEADGTVRAVVEGEENLVNDFIDWCHSGPSTSQVKKVKVDRLHYTGEFEDFAIRY